MTAVEGARDAPAGAVRTPVAAPATAGGRTPTAGPLPPDTVAGAAAAATDRPAAGPIVDRLRGETVSVVIPCLNESRNLPHVLPRIPAWVHEVVLVDDHSVDDSIAVARAVRPGIRVLVNTGPRGKGHALRAGLAAATGSLLVTLDADGSGKPEEIESFVAALVAGHDLAKGTRFGPGGGSDDISAVRRGGNAGLRLICQLLFGVRWTDFCHGYNAIRRDALDRLGLDAAGFDFEAQLNIRAARAGLRIREVPCFEDARITGTSRLSAARDGARVLRMIVREWRR